MRENVDQNNTEHGYFLRSESSHYSSFESEEEYRKT